MHDRAPSPLPSPKAPSPKAPSPKAAANATDGVRRLEARMAGLAMAAAHRLGPNVTAPLLDRLMGLMRARHPRAFLALAGLGDGRVLIDPTDQPVGLLLHLGEAPTIRLVERGSSAEAVVRGPLVALMDLMEGRIDGDALFFRRILTIEGDTGLVVALRNALDGEDIDLVAEVAAIAGPLGRVVPALRQEAMRAAGALFGLRDALLAPVNARIDHLERRIAQTARPEALRPPRRSA